MTPEERLKFVKHLVGGITSYLEKNIPDELVKSGDDGYIIYDTVLNLLHMYTTAIGFDEEDAHAHISYIFNANGMK